MTLEDMVLMKSLKVETIGQIAFRLFEIMIIEAMKQDLLQSKK